MSEPIHEYFGLSYAQYLAIPRSVLQSMPEGWQQRFVECLKELDATIDWMPQTGTYRVGLWERKENDDFEMYWDHAIDDPMADYHRGRRRIDHKKAT